MFGFKASGFCRDADEPRVDSATLMQPLIDRETRFTPSSYSELLILGRLIDLRQVNYFWRVSEKLEFSGSEFVSDSANSSWS